MLSIFKGMLKAMIDIIMSFILVLVNKLKLKPCVIFKHGILCTYRATKCSYIHELYPSLLCRHGYCKYHSIFFISSEIDWIENIECSSIKGTTWLEICTFDASYKHYNSGCVRQANVVYNFVKDVHWRFFLVLPWPIKHWNGVALH